MKGLLSQGGQPPVEEEMVEESTEMEAPEVEAPEGSPEADELLAQAVNDIYSEARLPKLKKLFQEGGVEGFPHAMGVAVIGGLSSLDVENIEPTTLAEVGTKLFEMVAEDIITSGEVEGVTPDILMSAVQQSIKMFAAKYPDKIDMEEFAAAWQEQMAAEGEAEAPMDPMAQQQAPMAPQAPAAPQGGLLSGGM